LLLETIIDKALFVTSQDIYIVLVLTKIKYFC